MNNLGNKTVLGFTQLITVLGILLLAPAWTLDYWQAWVYLCVFVTSAVLIITGDLLVALGFLIVFPLPGYKEYCQTVRYRLMPFVW